MPRGKGRRVARGAAIALAMLAVLTALLETGARVALGDDFVQGERRARTWKVCGRYDPELGWSNHPGVRARIHADDLIDYRVRINSLGFRDPERSLDPPPGVRRVLLLGDSVSWGWGVDDGERFSDLIEAELGPGVEVINLAVPGYGTDHHLWTLEHNGFAFQPDLVLLGMVLNDLVEARQDEMYGMAKPQFVRDSVSYTHLTLPTIYSV